VPALKSTSVISEINIYINLESLSLCVNSYSVTKIHVHDIYGTFQTVVKKDGSGVH
jgi:hypothetical protein